MSDVHELRSNRIDSATLFKYATNIFGEFSFYGSLRTTSHLIELSVNVAGNSPTGNRDTQHKFGLLIHPSVSAIIIFICVAEYVVEELTLFMFAHQFRVFNSIKRISIQ